VESAEDALDLLSKGTIFNMIVTDLEMPGMNGFEFAATCRNSMQARNVPIVAYTASMSEEVKKRSKEVGMNDCIVKTDRAGLLDTVSHWLTNAEVRA
jgi:two-component system chemotaxis sensor kinase CheA